MYNTIKKGIILTLASIIVSVGIYYFKFPEHFNFGGVNGLAILIAKLTPYSPSYINLVLNISILIMALLFLGKSFAIWSTYTTIIISGLIYLFDLFLPMYKPITNEPMLNLLFAIVLPAIGSAILFNYAASSGGTDIIAYILSKIFNFEIGKALLASDILIVLSTFIIFPIKTALFSIVGLVFKSFIIDNLLESIHLSKYFNIICDEPKEICDFITNKLHRSATITTATGAFTHKEKYIVFAVVNRMNAIELKKYIKNNHPSAFITITGTSEIIGKGFRYR